MAFPITLRGVVASVVVAATVAPTAAQRDRDAFFAAVAKELDGREIGDGVLHRCIAAVQHRFVKTPAT